MMQPTDNIEKEIGGRIALSNGKTAARLGLRFDKVVVRLLDKLRSATAQIIPQGQTIIVTLTAPIKLPAKTAADLEAEIREILASGPSPADRQLTIHQNRVQIRVAALRSRQSTSLVGLVHNPDIDAGLLLDLATHWLKETAKDG